MRSSIDAAGIDASGRTSATPPSSALVRWWCGLHGHLPNLKFEPNRLSLECTWCGKRLGPGWDLSHVDRTCIE